MVSLLRFVYSAFKFCYFKISLMYSKLMTSAKFTLNAVQYQSDFTAYGIPIIYVKKNGYFSIGSNFIFNSGIYYNMIGRQQKCYFIVYEEGKLHIGNNVSMSSTAIVCYKSITIGDNVKIGGNVVIYDTDFHSLNHEERNHLPEIYNAQKKEVLIKSGAFIGAHSTILKGVVVGENSIIGSGSVVTKNVPDNQVWAGNPAKFIREI